MSLRRVSSCFVAGTVLVLIGCGSTPQFTAREEPWRADEESACLASGTVRQTSFVQSRSSLGGPSVCGAARPFEMSAANEGRVTLKPPALLRCPMVPQVERWVARVVEPAARYYYGTSVAELSVAASYGCRAINHKWGGRLSEHGYANALDISAFTLADGRRITVKAGWWGDERERGFLRDVHKGGCREFTTVLGPEADAYHRDHFHLDLARHGRGGLRQICQ